MIFDLEGLNNLFSKIHFKSQPSAPDPVDPVATASAQGAANKETAVAQAFLNNVNESGPLGSREFEAFKDPTTGETRFRANTTLNPTGQAAFDAEQDVARGTNELAAGQIGRVEEAVSNPFSFGGLPDAPQADDAARGRVEQSLFDRNAQFLNPRFDQEQRDLETQLANQGIPRDSDAFRRELENFNLRKDSAFADARNQSILGGGAEQSRTFGLESSARDRGIQERSFERNIPLNEIGALLGTGQVGLPQFAAPPQTGIAGTDVIGATLAAKNQENQNFQTASSAANAFNSSLFGLGGTIGGGFASGGFRPTPRTVPGLGPFA